MFKQEFTYIVLTFCSAYGIWHLKCLDRNISQTGNIVTIKNLNHTFKGTELSCNSIIYVL